MRPSASAPFSRRDALKFLGLASGAALAAPVSSRLIAAEASTKSPSPPSPPAPSLAGPRIAYHRFKIGELEAIGLLDGGMAMPANASPFAVDEPPGAVTKALEAAWLPTERVQMTIGNLLVRVGSELVLIDAGGGRLMGEVGGRLLPRLAAAGVKPEQITAIILTHAHRDHFGGLVDGENRPAFPKAQVFIGRKEHDFWMTSAPDLSGMAVPQDAAKDFVLGAQTVLGAVKDRLHLVAGGDKILGGIELLDTPGHTPGHLAVVFGSGDEQLLHMADVAHHHALSFVHPGWRFAYDADPALAVETRKKLFDRAAADRLRLFGTHMPFPGLGRVRKLGEAYEFVLEPFSPV